MLCDILITVQADMILCILACYVRVAMLVAHSCIMLTFSFSTKSNVSSIHVVTSVDTEYIHTIAFYSRSH